MPHYGDLPNPDLLERIPLDARLIVDVGCGTGALGGAYKRRNPTCRYIGVEGDMARARIAASRIDEVVVTDIETHPLDFGTEKVDCLIYGDVLEHLRDPWGVLQRHVQTLSDTGTLLVCMPNVEHWSFAERLLRGTWDYEEQGLFDQTHLRWFSFDTTRRALAAAGVAVSDVTPRIFGMDQAREFSRAMRPALEALGIDPENYLARSAPLQHVWRARRQPMPYLHVVSTMLAPVGGVSHVRVLEPMQAIGTDSSILSQVLSERIVPALTAETPKIFILHRPALAGEAGLEPIRQLLGAGYVVICEFDDNPDYIKVLQQPDIQNFRAVHAVQTTTQPLVELLSRQNPEVGLFPNAVATLPDVRNYTDPGRVTLFFGGLNREDEWPPYVDALNAVSAVAGERLHFQIVNDRGLFDSLRSVHKSFTPLCDYETYQDLLSRSEISFMPLQDGAFNRCKSDLKFLEASSFRVTALASPVVYGDTIEDGKTGMLFRDPQELQQKLMRLVANPELGQAIADAARVYVAKERMLAYQVARRNAWYRSLWDRRHELTSALLARVPELLRPPAQAEASLLSPLPDAGA